MGDECDTEWLRKKIVTKRRTLTKNNCYNRQNGFFKKSLLESTIIQAYYTLLKTTVNCNV